MRNLLIMVGAPGSGKSTWIRDRDLGRYTLEPDSLRLLCSSPEMGLDGSFGISQKYDKKVWSLLDQLLSERMERGDFTIVDGTHTMKRYLSRYKKLADKYRYRTYVKVLNPPLETLLSQNKGRPKHKWVPDDVIQLHHERLKSLKIPGGFTEVADDLSNLNEKVRLQPLDCPAVWFIGDIHGCFDPLDTFLKKHYNSDDHFVFLGDYIDRGPKNLEVLEALCELGPNCTFLEGNHEKWLRMWLTGDVSGTKSKDFLLSTMPQLEMASPQSLLAIKDFARRLRLFEAIEHKGRRLFACHGGIPSSSFDFIPASQLIGGVGRYKESLEIAANFLDNSQPNDFQCHGHRNVVGSPHQVNERVFNLDGSPYNGGELRAVRFSDSIQTFSFKSDFVWESPSKNTVQATPVTRVEQLRKNRDVIEWVSPEGISSFSFKKSVFKYRKWNPTTEMARGLFVRDDQIVARSYQKFFNIGEIPIEDILRKVVYPVRALDKLNGYLGIISVLDGEPLICTKSRTQGQFQEWFQEIAPSRESILKVIGDKNISLIFEVIRPELDPHIIHYPSDEVVLLDAVRNDWEFQLMPDEFLIEAANLMGIRLREDAGLAKDSGELLELIEKAKLSQGEGVVFRDANNFMFKQKSDFYSKWKRLRGLLGRVCREGFVPSNEVHDAESLQFINWCRETGVSRDDSIIELRKRFLRHVK